MGEGKHLVKKPRLIENRKKKSCCGKKKCTCNKKKEKTQLCENSNQPKTIKQVCACGKLDCDCYKSTVPKPAARPTFVDVYKCDYGGDELKQTCICGLPECECHGRKRKIPTGEQGPGMHRSKGEFEMKQNDILPCVCGKPYCLCGKHKQTDIPEIEFLHINTCELHVAPPVKNYCVCGKPDCTCYKDTIIVDDDRECSYCVPLSRPLCVCGKINCDCNIDRVGEKKIRKKIDIPDAPARCICGKIFCECNVGRATAPSTERSRIPEGEDIKIELEKSDYVKQRERMMRTLDVPSLTEAKNTLGDLATFVYEECEAGLKTYIPTIPAMSYGDLWISPSDLLIPHVGLKAPLTRKHMQALTHEGILDIGHHIELKFVNQMEMEKEEALETQRQSLLKNFQDSIKQLIKDAEAKERATCQREMQRLTEEFEKRLIDEINEMKSKLKNEYVQLTATHDDRLNQKWEDKLKLATEETTKNITKKFLEELAQQEEILTMHFKVSLAKKEIQRTYELEKQQFEHSLEVQKIKHRLECKNIANMMYLLCMERSKCCEEKAFIEEHYKIQLEGRNKKISKQKRNIQSLKSEVENRLKEVELRETCILEILKQYQKFINFALRAAPTQAEFLLSIEKLMVFELTDALMKFKPPSTERLSRPCDVTLPWEGISPNEEMEVISSEKHGLEVDDHHQCLNELPIPKKKEDMVLPAFIFKNKLYVREDFRNLMSQGIKPSPSHELWSDDIDLLMKTLRKSVSEEYLESDKSDSSAELPKATPKENSAKSSTIQFRLSEDFEPVSDIIQIVSSSESRSLKERLDTKISLKYSLPLSSPVDHSKIGMVETNPFLLGTQSSLELFAPKFNMKLKKIERDIILPVDEEEEVEVATEGTFITKLNESDTPDFVSADKLDLDKEEFEYSHFSSADAVKSSAGENKKITSDARPKDKRDRTSSRNIATETRDSIILRQASLAKAQKSFSISPIDSIDVKKDSEINSLLRQKSSKLVMAQDSLVLLRTSRSVLREPMVCSVCHKKEDAKRKRTHLPRECDKCAKNKESLEVLSGGIIAKKSQLDDCDNLKQIKVSHVEVISIKDERKSSVGFESQPVIAHYAADFAENLDRLYKTTKKATPVKKKKAYVNPCIYQKNSSKVRIAGERDGVEHIQNDEEFTIDRMRSFISILSSHPTLIKMFTACQR